MLSFLHTLVETGLDSKKLDNSSAFNFRHRLWFKNLKSLFAFVFILYVGISCAFQTDAPLFIHIIGWVSLIFFGVGGLIVLYKTVTLRSRGLRHVSHSDEGLYIEGHIIPWHTIEGFEPMKVMANKIGMLVKTNNNEEIIANTRNPIMRLSYRHSLKMYGAIFYIHNDYIDCSMDAFVALCNEHIAKDRKKRERIAL